VEVVFRNYHFQDWFIGNRKKKFREAFFEPLKIVIFAYLERDGSSDQKESVEITRIRMKIAKTEDHKSLKNVF